MQASDPRILIVDEDAELAKAISVLIREQAVAEAIVDRARTLRHAQDLIRRQPYSIYILDYLLPDGTGLDLLRQLRSQGLLEPVIFVAGRGGEQSAVDAMKAGATDYLLKGQMTADGLASSIRSSLEGERTQRRLRAAEALRAVGEKRFRSLIEHSMDAVGLVDCAGTILYSSPASTKVIGFSPETLVGMSVFDVLHPDDLDRARRLLESLLAQPEESLHAELCCRHATGAWKQIECTGTNLLHDESIGAIVLNYRDITEAKRDAEALRHSEERYRRIVDTAQEGICTTDIDGRVSYSNHRIAEMLGSDPDDLIGRPLLDFVHDSMKEAASAILCSARPSVPDQIDIRFCRRDQSELWAIVSTRPMSSDDGEIVGSLVMIADISERKRAEQRLAVQYAATRALAEANSVEAGVADFLRAIVEGLGHDLAALWIVHGDENLLRCSATWKVDDPALDNLNAVCLRTVFNYAVGLPGIVWARREPSWLPSMAAHVVAERRQAAEQAGMLSAFAFPVVSETEVIGVIEFYQRRPRFDDPALRDMVVALGSQLGQYLVRKRAEEALRHAHDQLKKHVLELERHSRQITLLSELSDLLQACLAVPEAYAAIQQMARPLFPDCSGRLYVVNDGRTLVDAVVSWGEHSPTESLFSPDQCWALRRGRVHVVCRGQQSLRCPHVGEVDREDYCCVPLIAQGEAMGVLHLWPAAAGALTPEQQQLAATVAEHIAMALANLKLRETLQRQSTRDALTGLFNRRYMEEMLEHELHRAERADHSFGIIMLDLDNFKQVNDTLGHDAGDAVLRQFGDLLNSAVRRSDVVCRYGGEEFLILLPDASLVDSSQRAEQIRAIAEKMNVEYRGQMVGIVTVSLGVAIFPDHGPRSEDVIRAADTALYIAKRNGRNRVVTADRSLRRHRPLRVALRPDHPPQEPTAGQHSGGSAAGDPSAGSEPLNR